MWQKIHILGRTHVVLRKRQNWLSTLNTIPLHGIPQAIVETIKALCTNAKATVITTDGETAFFGIKSGVLQGDTLAPFLFIIVLNYVLRLSLDSINDKGMQIHPRWSQRHPARFLTDLDFADDLALVSEIVENAESLLQSLERAAKLVGLHCNESKTEYISTNPNNHGLLSLSGAAIKQVDDSKSTSAHTLWILRRTLNPVRH